MTMAMTEAGIPRQISAWRAASDAGLLVHGAGIPCVLFGPGDIEQAAHRPDEWIDLGSGCRSARVRTPDPEGIEGGGGWRRFLTRNTRRGSRGRGPGWARPASTSC